MNRKIATCCYCGTRALLVLDARRHELACRACGAPLHEMKALPQRQEEKKKSRPIVAAARAGRPVLPDRESRHDVRPLHGKKKRRKPVARRVLEEIWDVFDDLID